MKSELQDNIFNRFPKMFSQKDKDMTVTAMCWGLSCGDGWYDLIMKTCEKIEDHILNLEKSGVEIKDLDFSEKYDPEAFYYPEFTQVKEKFGTLRMYFNGGDDTICQIIDSAEDESAETCELCGKEGSSNEAGWITTRCEDCEGN